MMKHLFGNIFYDITITPLEPNLTVWIWGLKVRLSFYPHAGGIWRWCVDKSTYFSNKFDIDDEEPDVKECVTTEFFAILSCPICKLQIYYLQTKAIDE